MSIKKSLRGWLGGRKPQNEAAAAKAPGEETRKPPAEGTMPAELEPEVVAAIAAVIAVEVKMFRALQGARFTFAAGGAGQGWNETGRLLVRPYQGVR